MPDRALVDAAQCAVCGCSIGGHYARDHDWTPRTDRAVVDDQNLARRDGRSPDADEMEDPRFHAIWNAIKGWDVQREPGSGYAGANGSDAVAILDALRRLEAPRALVALFEVFAFYGDEGERFIGAFVTVDSAKEYAQTLSEDLQAEYIVRGPNGDDPYDQVFLQAIYVNGEEVEDCDHS